MGDQRNETGRRKKNPRVQRHKGTLEKRGGKGRKKRANRKERSKLGEKMGGGKVYGARVRGHKSLSGTRRRKEARKRN